MRFYMGDRQRDALTARNVKVGGESKISVGGELPTASPAMLYSKAAGKAVGNS